MHEHNFVYNAEASEPGVYVTVCAGCGEAKATVLAKAPPLMPTEIPGVWDVRRPTWPPRRRTIGDPHDTGIFRKVID